MNNNNMNIQDSYQLADYILNHYDKNSHADKLVLSDNLQRRFDTEYNKGIDTDISLVKEINGESQESLICGLKHSKK